MSLKCFFGTFLFLGISCTAASVWACYGYGGLDRRPLSELVEDLGWFGR